MNQESDFAWQRRTLWAPFLLASIFLAAIIRAHLAWQLPVAGLLGLLLCYRFNWLGFIFSCLLLGALLFHQVSVGEDLKWNAVFSLSLFSALLLFTLCLPTWQESTPKENSTPEALSCTEALLGSCISMEKARLEHELERERKEKASLQQQLQTSQAESQEKVDALAVQIAESAREKHELLQDKREKRRFEGLYLQLREQFMQKTGALEETRKELFAAQEKLTACEIDREALREELGAELQQEMQQLIAANEVELQRHEEENAHLHALVRSLLVEQGAR